MRKGIGVRTLGRAEDDLVRVLEAEGDGVAILQLAAIDFFPVDEEAAALAAILDVEAIGLDDHGGAVARDAAGGELRVVVGFGSAADPTSVLCGSRGDARALQSEHI